MAKCTGMRCPMQVGYKVEECNHMDCPYRTEPMTNADRIRAMSDWELADFLEGIHSCSNCVKRWNNCFPNWDALEWLQQPAKEDNGKAD